MELIAAWIDPTPEYTIAAVTLDDKTIIELTVKAGDQCPYFYVNTVGGAEVAFFIFDDRLEIISPGSKLDGRLPKM